MIDPSKRTAQPVILQGINQDVLFIGILFHIPEDPERALEKIVTYMYIIESTKYG